MVIQRVVDRAGGTSGEMTIAGTRTPYWSKTKPLALIAGLFGLPSAGDRGRTGWDRVVKAAVLVVGDDQQTPVPERRVANRFVGGFDQSLAARNAVHGMLRRAAGVRATGHVAVVWLDKRVRVRIWTLKVRGKACEGIGVDAIRDALQGRNLGNPAEQWTVLVDVDAPLHPSSGSAAS